MTLDGCSLLVTLSAVLAGHPVVAQQPAYRPDLDGRWTGTATHAGDSTPIAIEIERLDSTHARLRLSLPAIHWRRLPIGPVPYRFEGDTVTLGPFGFVYDSSAGTLRGTLPSALVPIYEIPVLLHRAHRLDLPPRGQPTIAGRTPVWVYLAGAAVWGGATYADGVVYAGDDAGILHAVDAGTGTLQWRFAADAPIRSRPIVAHGSVYFQADDGWLYALSATSGGQQWRIRISDSVIVRRPLTDPSSRYDPIAAAVAPARELLLVGTNEGRLLALDRVHGEPVWSFQAADAIVAAPRIADGTVYVGSFDHHVYAIDAATGTERWRHDTGAPVVSTPMVADGLVIVGSRSYDLLGLDARSGALVWRRYFWFSWIESSVTLRDGVGYVGSSDAQIVLAFDPHTGAALWRADVFGWAWGHPAATQRHVFVATAGLVGYPAEHRAGVLALDRASGAPVWRFQLERVPDSGAFGFPGPVAVSDDFVFAAAVDGRLYALRR